MKPKQKKKITKKGYKTLAIIWMLAAATMAVAIVRWPLISIPRILLLAVSLYAAVTFWKSYKNAPEDYDIKNDSEENNHE